MNIACCTLRQQAVVDANMDGCVIHNQSSPARSDLAGMNTQNELVEPADIVDSHGSTLL